jgi:hypothetical protein
MTALQQPRRKLPHVAVILNCFCTCLKLFHSFKCCGALNIANCKLLCSQIPWSHLWLEVFISACGVQVKWNLTCMLLMYYQIFKLSIQPVYLTTSLCTDSCLTVNYCFPTGWRGRNTDTQIMEGLDSPGNNLTGISCERVGSVAFGTSRT